MQELRDEQERLRNKQRKNKNNEDACVRAGERRRRPRRVDTAQTTTAGHRAVAPSVDGSAGVHCQQPCSAMQLRASAQRTRTRARTHTHTHIPFSHTRTISLFFTITHTLSLSISHPLSFARARFHSLISPSRPCPFANDTISVPDGSREPVGSVTATQTPRLVLLVRLLLPGRESIVNNTTPQYTDGGDAIRPHA